MRKEKREMLNRIKSEISEESQHWSRDEREEFFGLLNDWSYAEYETALIEGEAEMQNYEEE